MADVRVGAGRVVFVHPEHVESRQRVRGAADDVEVIVSQETVELLELNIFLRSQGADESDELRYIPALYVLLNPFRLFVTVKVPSCCAETLIQYAGPL
jgi:hypothetical protein